MRRPQKPSNARLVANSRPVGVPAAPRSSGTGPRSPKKDSARSRPEKRAQLPSAPATERATANRVTVGGLSISVRLLVVALMAAVIAIVLIPMLLQWGDQQREYRAAVQDSEAALRQEERLQAELENWDNPEYISSQARSRLGYADPGETQYIVTDAPDDEDAVLVATEKEDWPPKPWNLRLQEQLLEIDNPPAVKAAAQVETITLPEDDQE